MGERIVEGIWIIAAMTVIALTVLRGCSVQLDHEYRMKLLKCPVEEKK